MNVVTPIRTVSQLRECAWHAFIEGGSTQTHTSISPKAELKVHVFLNEGH